MGCGSRVFSIFCVSSFEVLHLEPDSQNEKCETDNREDEKPDIDLTDVTHSELKKIVGDFLGIKEEEEKIEEDGGGADPAGRDDQLKPRFPHAQEQKQSDADARENDHQHDPNVDHV